MSDDYQSIPVAAARAAVQASGELEGVEGPLFLGDSDNAEWEPFFSKALYGADAHPEFAKVTVTRKGQKPREVVIAWDEYADQMDADPAWDAIREKKPMSVFGGEAERHAYRVVFADVLAEAFPPLKVQVFGQRDPETYPAAGWGAVDEPPRDWFAEVKVADAAKLNALYDEAREAGALVEVAELQQAFTTRMLELVALPKPTPAAVPQRKPDGQQGNRRRRGKR